MDARQISQLAVGVDRARATQAPWATVDPPPALYVKQVRVRDWLVFMKKGACVLMQETLV